MLTSSQVATLRRDVGGKNRVAVAMDLAGLTQVQLAEKTGYTQSYISRVSNGHYRDLPGETMRTFARVFGTSMEDLFPSVGTEARTA